MTKYLLFIPACNVEPTIGEVLDEIRHTRPGMDVLVINDGSADKTGHLLDERKDITVIRNQKNLGYGATLIKGFEYAISHHYDYLITLDADKQHQPREIERFIFENKKQEADILSGSRYLNVTPKEISQAPVERRRVNQRITRYINHITGYHLTDAFCGFKLYKVDSLKNLHLSESGYGMPLQLLMEAWKKGLAIREVPVKLIYFDRESTNVTQKLFSRYRYYLEIIKNEMKSYEATDISSPSR